jgi:hypothetical protein
MKAKPLPYDMGNSGDLIKHGMVAEFVKWWCHYNKKPFVFYDPFGGRPWVEPPHRKVAERVSRLRDCALSNAQPAPDFRYYGSGHLVKNIAHHVNGSANVFVSDRNEDALDDLTRSGLEKISHKGFNPEDGHSLLGCDLTKNNVSLLLLDPFADFLESSTQLCPKIANFVGENEMAVALFVLSDESMSTAHREFSNFRKSESFDSILQLSFSCQQLKNTGIRGEEKYLSEVFLFLPAKYRNSQLEELKNNLKNCAGLLTQVLGQEIEFVYL